MKFELSPHIAVQVSDYEKALAFYRDLIGMEIIEHGDDESELRCGPIHFHMERSEAGRTFFEFKVDDAEEARRLLEERGCTTAPTHLPKSYLVADPFGLRYHIWEE
jgi:catechol 2,3-dioxygenase-like lactoylglutathione lyase family enzyme